MTEQKLVSDCCGAEYPNDVDIIAWEICPNCGKPCALVSRDESQPFGKSETAGYCKRKEDFAGVPAPIRAREGMNKPRLLDLFCCAGGAAMGYHRAGFEVVGVDINPQPHYPFEFHQADALTYPLEGFDAYHASPPCQAYSQALNYGNKDRERHEDLIAPVRNMLSETGKPFVIENVPNSPLKNYIKLDGTMFGLKTIKRRWFELHGFEIVLMPMPGIKKGAVKSGEYVGIMGHSVNPAERCRRQDLEQGYQIDWGMTRHELRQAIPPAYTEFIGKYLMAHILSEQGK